MKTYRIIGFAIIAFFVTSGSYCQDFADRLDSLNTNLNDLQGGIETNSTVEVKLDPDLQAQIDDVVAMTLNSIRQETMVRQGQLYFRELVKNGDSITLTQCCVYDAVDLATMEVHANFFSDVCWNAELRPEPMTGEEEALCYANWPLPEEWDDNGPQDTSGNFGQEA